MSNIISTFTEFNDRNGANEIFYRIPDSSSKGIVLDESIIMIPKSNMKLSDLAEYLEKIYNIKIENGKPDNVR